MSVFMFFFMDIKVEKPEKKKMTFREEFSWVKFIQSNQRRSVIHLTPFCLSLDLCVRIYLSVRIYQPVDLTHPAHLYSPTNFLCAGLASTGARLLLSFSLLWRIRRSRWVGKRPIKGREAHGPHISTDGQLAPFFHDLKMRKSCLSHMVEIS